MYNSVTLVLIAMATCRIMMLSVLKHTKNPVKFWFLKNFLSPPFKVCQCVRERERERKKEKERERERAHLAFVWIPGV
jgi:hypothetical protein